MERLKLLVAVSTPEFQNLLAEVLKKDELLIAATVDQACKSLDPTFDLIICGIHFDNGRIYDFLKYAKTSSQTKHIPFLCVQLSGGILPFSAFRAMEAAFDLLGGDLFVQVAKWRIELGDEQAFAKLKDVVHALANKAREEMDNSEGSLLIPCIKKPLLAV